ncbi:hypothetical protein G3I60_04955 [Streptomyces sp. SID13666]|uniref:hypothetical protein n=1 Tax=Streptomyces sp. SID13666 TaxID=2706054 RepID=UPI0013C0E146|nr:hypothetical protein [Streptomyces sp. SID13666]NEA53518.1 hypothetical protein [Streptomyces sp. SID13666]
MNAIPAASAVQLFTPDCTSYGPYVGLPLASFWTPGCRHLFTRKTAQQIVDDLHNDECGLTAEWHGDVLRFTWATEYRDDAGTEDVTPDAHGRYAIGGLWPWDEWGDHSFPSAEQCAYGVGAVECWLPAMPESVPVAMSGAYARGRAEALRLMLRPTES